MTIQANLTTIYPPIPTHPKSHPAKRAVISYTRRIHSERDAMIDAMCDAGKFDGAVIGAMTDKANQADNLKFNICNCTLNYADAEASRLWADFCQSHQLCLECGGELVSAFEGNDWHMVAGEPTENVVELDYLECRECGTVSNWKPVCGMTGEELPF